MQVETQGGADEPDVGQVWEENQTGEEHRREPEHWEQQEVEKDNKKT